MVKIQPFPKRKSLNSIFCKIGHMKSLHPKGFKTAQKLASEARLIMAFLRGLDFAGTACPLFGKCGRFPLTPHSIFLTP
jgi:hypothetical protein